MRIYDRNGNTAEVHMYGLNNIDWTEDFFEAGALSYDDNSGEYEVDSVSYCIEQAQDYYESEANDDEYATVEVSGETYRFGAYGNYFWIDTNESGYISLYMGDMNEDGKDRESERCILRASYDDMGIEEDDKNAWSKTDTYILKELGFLPEYEVN